MLRGVYECTGTTASPEGQALPVRLEVVPDYVDQRGYDITGTVKLGEAEAIPFEGEVSGGDTQLYVLTEPIEPPTFEIHFSYEGEPWHLGGSYDVVGVGPFGLFSSNQLPMRIPLALMGPFSTRPITQTRNLNAWYGLEPVASVDSDKL